MTYSERAALTVTLLKDADEHWAAFRKAQEEGRQARVATAARAAIITMCAAMECSVNSLLGECLDIDTRGSGRRPLTDAERLIVGEWGVVLTDRGEAKLNRIRPDIRRKARLADQLLSSLAGSERVDFQSAEWKSVCDTFQVRNRLMHPRADKGVDVVAAEVEEGVKAMQWWFDQSFRIIDAVIAQEESAAAKGSEAAP